MVLNINSCVELNNGVKMPYLGLGVFRSPAGEVTRSAVRTALENGYRMVDTARIYCNERSVGRGLQDSALPREQYFVTTKLWKSDWSNPRQGLEQSLERLQLDYVDLYLLHWPFKGFAQAYLELEKLQQEGLCRAIGVCGTTGKSGGMPPTKLRRRALALLPPTRHRLRGVLAFRR